MNLPFVPIVVVVAFVPTVLLPNDDDGVRSAINTWIGTGSTVGLKDEQINRFFTIVLSTAAEFNPQS